MTDDATPKKTRPNYSRPKKFPANVNVMITEEQRASIDGRAVAREQTIGAMTRSVLTLGLDLDSAFMSDPALSPEIDRLAREARVNRSEAMATLLRFAVDESARRVARNAHLAASVAQNFADHGFAVDGVEVTGGIRLSAE